MNLVIRNYNYWELWISSIDCRSRFWTNTVGPLLSNYDALPLLRWSAPVMYNVIKEYGSPHVIKLTQVPSLNLLMKVDMLLEMKHCGQSKITSYWISLWGTPIKLLPKMQRKFTNIIACHNFSPIASIPGVFSPENQTAYIFCSIWKIGSGSYYIEPKVAKTSLSNRVSPKYRPYLDSLC